MQWLYRLMGEDIGPLSTNELISAVVDGRVDIDTYVSRDNGVSWVLASTVKGLFEKARSTPQGKQKETEREARQALASQLRKEKAQAELERKRYASITISTSSPSTGQTYEIIDTVFAFDGDGSASFFSAAHGDPNIAFQRVKDRLRHAAFSIGADAVINCQFEYRVAVSTDHSGQVVGTILNQLTDCNFGFGSSHAQVIEIFAYGTAIRYASNNGKSSF